VTAISPRGSRSPQAIDLNDFFVFFMHIRPAACLLASRFAQKYEKIVCQQCFGSAGIRPSAMTGVD
jgi:hypothetical protein